MKVKVTKHFYGKDEEKDFLVGEVLTDSEYAEKRLNLFIENDVAALVVEEKDEEEKPKRRQNTRKKK
ncbi:hypothetical protein ACQQ97_06985 [Anaerovoracaceae bacterium SGI.195]